MVPKGSAANAEIGEKDRHSKKLRKGFNVGNQNLPDGIHRRKLQKIKHNLIRNAKVKKSYTKLKDRQQVGTARPYNPLDAVEEEPASLELHPDRQAMIKEPGAAASQHDTSVERSRQRRLPRQKPLPFHKEAKLAQQRRQEREKQQLEYEEGRRQRQAKIEERERFRKAMAKARWKGKDGQRKLGRESKVLLEKVQRVMGG